MLSLKIQLSRANFQLEVNDTVDLSKPTAVLGANGSGKTSLLRSIVGLERVSGRIEFNGGVWLDSANRINIPTRCRAIGYLSQTPQLFPYMNIETNLRFAENLSHNRESSVGGLSTDEILKSFDLQHLRDKRVHEISGGELSRAALAQTLLSRPTLLLLDEPLASIDINRKRDLIPYLEDYLREYQLPMLYVTHDISEVARLCPQAIILENGSIANFGESSSVLAAFSQAVLFNSSEFSTLLKVNYESYDEQYQMAIFSFGSENIYVPTTNRGQFPTQVYLRIRHLDVGLAKQPPKEVSIRNVLHGQIVSIANAAKSPYADIEIRCQDQLLHSRITRIACHELQLEENQQIYALIKSASIEI